MGYAVGLPATLLTLANDCARIRAERDRSQAAAPENSAERSNVPAGRGGSLAGGSPRKGAAHPRAGARSSRTPGEIIETFEGHEESLRLSEATAVALCRPSKAGHACAQPSGRNRLERGRPGHAGASRRATCRRGQSRRRSLRSVGRTACQSCGPASMPVRAGHAPRSTQALQSERKPFDWYAADENHAHLIAFVLARCRGHRVPRCACWLSASVMERESLRLRASRLRQPAMRSRSNSASVASPSWHAAHMRLWCTPPKAHDNEATVVRGCSIRSVGRDGLLPLADQTHVGRARPSITSDLLNICASGACWSNPVGVRVPLPHQPSPIARFARGFGWQAASGERMRRLSTEAADSAGGGRTATVVVQACHRARHELQRRFRRSSRQTPPRSRGVLRLQKRWRTSGDVDRIGQGTIGEVFVPTDS